MNKCQKFFLLLIVANSILKSQIIINISTDEVVNFSVIDPSGRKTGYNSDSVQGEYLNQIVNSDYSFEGVGYVPDSDESEVSEGVWQFLLYFKKENSFGTYKIQTYSDTTEIYKINIRIDTPGMDSQPVKTEIFSVISSGTSQHFTIYIDSTNMYNAVIQKAVSVQEIQKEVNSFAELSLIVNSGIANSLRQKLDNANKQFEKDQTVGAINLLKAFINEVRAKQGNGISQEAAGILIADAQQLMNEWSTQ